MTADFYGTAAAVKLRTGIAPDDFALDDDAALVSFIEELLTEVTDLMNRSIRRSTNYNEDTTLASIPAGLAGIANDIVASSIRDFVATRQTPVVRIDDFAVSSLQSRVFTTDVQRRLRLYGARGVGEISVDPGDVADSTSDFVTAADLDAMDSNS